MIERDECAERDASGYFRCNKPGPHKGERHTANHPATGIQYTWGYVRTDDEIVTTPSRTEPTRGDDVSVEITCAHCPNSATKKWPLLGGDGPMGFGHRDVCDEHYEAERAHRNNVLREALDKLQATRPSRSPSTESEQDIR